MRLLNQLLSGSGWSISQSKPAQQCYVVDKATLVGCGVSIPCSPWCQQAGSCKTSGICSDNQRPGLGLGLKHKRHQVTKKRKARAL
jgi:hypothetical protein